jgi:hypothetical protein
MAIAAKILNATIGAALTADNRESFEISGIIQRASRNRRSTRRQQRCLPLLPQRRGFRRRRKFSTPHNPSSGRRRSQLPM